MISLQDVSVALPAAGVRRMVLSDVTASFRRGGWYAVAGPNGSGKTTLLAVMAGLIEPTAGEIRTEGELPVIALLLQEPDNQFVTTSVAHELELSAQSPASASAPAALDGAVERFRLAEFLHRNPHELSGGEKQRLAFASVWLQQPDLLLLDEPTSFLDAQTYDECVALLREMNAAGTTIVWATPGGEELSLAEETICLLDGRVARAGPVDDGTMWVGDAHFELTRTPVGRLAATLVAAAEADRTRGVDPAARRRALAAGAIEALAEAVTSLVPDRPPGEPAFPAPASPEAGVNTDPVCTFRSVGFSYGDVVAIEDLDLEIRRGECVGIAGGNGAGKTTLLALAGGVMRPSRGKVHRARSDSFANSKREGAVHVHDQDVFYLFQSPERLFFAETVMEELAFGLVRAGLDQEQVRARAEASLAEVDLEPSVFLERSPFRLSFGEMRRVAFAVALSLSPRLLLLDEPTSCLDDDGREVLARILTRYRVEGRAVAIASHDIDFLASVCDRIVYLRDGRATVELDLREAVPPDRWPDRVPAIVRLQACLREAGREVPWTTRPAELLDALTRRSAGDV